MFVYCIKKNKKREKNNKIYLKIFESIEEIFDDVRFVYNHITGDRLFVVAGESSLTRDESNGRIH